MHWGGLGGGGWWCKQCYLNSLGFQVQMHPQKILSDLQHWHWIPVSHSDYDARQRKREEGETETESLGPKGKIQSDGAVGEWCHGRQTLTKTPLRAISSQHYHIPVE